MEWIETTGRTVDEALDAALDRLGVDEEDAEFEVIEEPKAGLFGRLRAEARVRARVRPTHPRPKGEREGRSRKRGRGPRGQQGQGQPGQAQDSPEPEERPQAPTATRGAGDQRGGNGRDAPHVPLADQAEVARQFLEGLMGTLEMPASVEVRDLDEDTVELGVTGEELGLLIGPKGTTLNALQDLTRTVVNRRTGARNGRLLVDVAGYREKRKIFLERFVREVAAEVKASGNAKALEPMSPADRKIVHDTVNAIEGVTTSSEGEEPRRRVVIVPS